MKHIITGKLSKYKVLKLLFDRGLKMKETMLKMLNAKKRELERQQEYFRIDIKNMNSSTYEDNAISSLLEIKKLKTEIAQLEFCLQLR